MGIRPVKNIELFVSVRRFEDLHTFPIFATSTIPWVRS